MSGYARQDELPHPTAREHAVWLRKLGFHYDDISAICTLIYGKGSRGVVWRWINGYENHNAYRRRQTELKRVKNDPKYRGISWDKEKSKWRVRVRGQHVGYYVRLDQALEAKQNER